MQITHFINGYVSIGNISMRKKPIHQLDTWARLIIDRFVKLKDPGNTNITQGNVVYSLFMNKPYVVFIEPSHYHFMSYNHK